jgi:hypothetical protein
MARYATYQFKKERLAQLRQSFAERERAVRARVRSKHAPHIQFLKEKGVFLENIRDFSANKVAAGTIAASLLINPLSAAANTSSHQPATKPAPSHTATPTQISEVLSAEDPGIVLTQALKGAVSAGSQDLTLNQEVNVAKIIKDRLNLNASAELDGYRLNRSFGLIGAEQHLYRYPGDNILEQLHTPAEYAMYAGAGIAPHVGAYGYFAPSKAEMTRTAEERERWYVVAQTFLSPQFKANPNATAQFFKYRKFIVINPDTGQAVIGDLADAGPGEYTGKSFGGSPEVMNYLGYGSGPRKGRVVFMMINDPNNQIPLGPVQRPFGISK